MVLKHNTALGITANMAYCMQYAREYGRARTDKLRGFWNADEARRTHEVGRQRRALPGIKALIKMGLEG